jgi:hypothetical protein
MNDQLILEKIYTEMSHQSGTTQMDLTKDEIEMLLKYRQKKNMARTTRPKKFDEIEIPDDVREILDKSPNASPRNNIVVTHLGNRNYGAGWNLKPNDPKEQLVKFEL